MGSKKLRTKNFVIYKNAVVEHVETTRHPSATPHLHALATNVYFRVCVGITLPAELVSASVTATRHAELVSASVT